MRITCFSLFSLTPASSIPLDIFSWNIYDTFDDEEHLSCRFISFAFTIYFSACKTTIICLVWHFAYKCPFTACSQEGHIRCYGKIPPNIHFHFFFAHITIAFSVILPLPLYCSIKYLHLISPLQSPPVSYSFTL